MKDLDNRVDKLEANVATITNRVDVLKVTIDNFILEMRDRDNKRDEDIRELRRQREEDRAKHESDMKEIAKQREEDNARHKEEMKEISQKIDNTIRHIQGLTIASMVGIGAIAVSVIVFVANSIFNPSPPVQYYYPPPAQTQSAQIPTVR